MLAKAKAFGKQTLSIIHGFALLLGCRIFPWLILLLALFSSFNHLVHQFALLIDVSLRVHRLVGSRAKLGLVDKVKEGSLLRLPKLYPLYLRHILSI